MGDRIDRAKLPAVEPAGARLVDLGQPDRNAGTRP